MMTRKRCTCKSTSFHECTVWNQDERFENLANINCRRDGSWWSFHLLIKSKFYIILYYSNILDIYQRNNCLEKPDLTNNTEIVKLDFLTRIW